MKASLKKGVLAFSVILLGSLVMYQTVVSTSKFMQSPTFATSSFVDQKDATFPDLTGCFKDKTIPLKRDEMEKQNLTFEEVMTSEDSFRNMTYSDTFDIFPYMYIRMFEYDYEIKSSGFRLSPKYEENNQRFRRNEMISTKYHPNFGACQTFRYSQMLRQMGLYYYYVPNGVNTDLDFIFFVHEPGSFWRTTKTSPGFILNKEKSQIQVYYDEIRTIPSGNNDCGRDEPDECFENHLKKEMKEKLGCQPVWLDTNVTKICQSIAEVEKAKSIFEQSIAQIDQICKMPCNFLNIRTGARNYESSNRVRMYIYFPYKVLLTQETYLYTGLKFVAEVAGVAGLALGLSFYHVAKLIIYIFDIKIKSLIQQDQ